MGWLDASDYLVMDIATRNRVDELRSTVDTDRWIHRARGLCGLRDRDTLERLSQSRRNLKKIVVAQGVPLGHSA